jgi:hypothetical protein
MVDTEGPWDRFFSNFFGFPIDIIPTWLSILVCHVAHEQQARWWKQFRDLVSVRNMNVNNKVCATIKKMKLFLRIMLF